MTSGSSEGAKTRVSLAELGDGVAGVVVQIAGGRGAASRLDAMGVRPGVHITKMNGLGAKGPVTMRIGHSRIAVGYGMASKVIVEIQGE